MYHAEEYAYSANSTLKFAKIVTLNVTVGDARDIYPGLFYFLYFITIKPSVNEESIQCNQTDEAEKKPLRSNT